MRSDRRQALLGLLLLLLTAVSCASPQKDGKRLASVDEEAYIDLKHGFSIVVPTSWQRERIPVSSPRYRSDTVIWQIGGQKGSKDSLQIKSVPTPTAADLRKVLTAFILSRDDKTTEEIQEFKHPAGTALKTTGTVAAGGTTYFAFEGHRRIFLISFKIAGNDDEQLLPTIEKVILSFSILQN